MRESPDGSGEFRAQHDVLTGQISSHVTMYDPEMREDPHTWDKSNFTVMGDGRIFLVHYFFNHDGHENLEMHNKPQPELKELLDKHVGNIEAIEKQRNTWQARLARLGHRILEGVRPDPYRMTPRRIKKML